jgi:ectoine hydroxylase-related dioxygenase (phytanoyl-CoA dioxygenase family)
LGGPIRERRLGESLLQLHFGGENDHLMHGAGDKYQTLFGMLNRDDRVWECAAHRDVQRVVQHFLGHSYRVVEACSKPSWPGCPVQGLHVDSASNFHVVPPPECPWMINTIWMLSDFTVENGCTRVVPMSHRARVKAPPFQESDLIRPLEGKAGSVVLWHSGLFHQGGPNTSRDAVRLGLNIAYYPSWMNNWVEGGHQPLWPETYARMPPRVQRLMVGIHGHDRSEHYEWEKAVRPRL